MPDRPSATDGSDQKEAADGGYFAPLAPARYVQLTTFKRDGIPVSATVQGLVAGERAYFRARSQSGTAKRLRYTDAVQVTPCSVLGWTYGPPLDATARLLPCEEARRVAAELDRKYRVRHRFLIRLLRRQAVYYELLADDTAGEPDGLSGRLAASLIIRVDSSRGFMHAGAATPTSLALAYPPSKTRSRPSDYTQIITVSMSVPARKPAAHVQADEQMAS
jgi:uncharacterized protein